MNLENTSNLSLSNVLMQLVNEIKIPLDSIIQANNKILKTNADQFQDDTSEIIFSSSQEITSLIEEVLKLANEKEIIEKTPLIYRIYNSNEKVQSICKREINLNKISKQDTIWLLDLETEVYKNIKHKDLNLYDLSYKMAVSERQLHRKIKNLLHITPNKYIRILRLHKAKQLIDDYVYDTISQISYAVGYHDTHYFSKLFNEQYGIFPKELLKERRF